MKCTICKTGETHSGTTTVTLQRENSAAVTRDVPAEICENCGEPYLGESTASRVYANADATVNSQGLGTASTVAQPSAPV